MSDTLRFGAERGSAIDYFGEEEPLEYDESPYSPFRKVDYGGMSQIYEKDSTTIRKATPLVTVEGTPIEQYHPLKTIRLHYMGKGIALLEGEVIIAFPQKSLRLLQHSYTESLLLQELDSTPHIPRYRGSYFASVNKDLYSVLEMEYVEGKALSQWFELHKRMSYSDAGRIIKDTADVLTALQEHEIAHRDIKFDNLIYKKGEKPGAGFTTVIDFGLSCKLNGSPFYVAVPKDISQLLRKNWLQTGFIVGSAGYMTPEQVRGEAVSTQSDIFQLGIVAFRLLTRETVFPKDCLDDKGHFDLERLAQVAYYTLRDRDNLLKRLYVKQLPSSLIEAMASVLDPDPAKRDLEPLRKEAEEIAQQGYESLPN